MAIEAYPVFRTVQKMLFRGAVGIMAERAVAITYRTVDVDTLEGYIVMARKAKPSQIVAVGQDIIGIFQAFIGNLQKKPGIGAMGMVACRTITDFGGLMNNFTLTGKLMACDAEFLPLRDHREPLFPGGGMFRHLPLVARKTLALFDGGMRPYHGRHLGMAGCRETVVGGDGKRRDQNNGSDHRYQQAVS